MRRQPLRSPWIEQRFGSFAFVAPFTEVIAKRLS
jgi:hypothetical protein